LSRHCYASHDINYATIMSSGLLLRNMTVNVALFHESVSMCLCQCQHVSLPCLCDIWHVFPYRGNTSWLQHDRKFKESALTNSAWLSRTVLGRSCLEVDSFLTTPAFPWSSPPAEWKMNWDERERRDSRESFNKRWVTSWILCSLQCKDEKSEPLNQRVDQSVFLCPHFVFLFLFFCFFVFCYPWGVYHSSG